MHDDIHETITDDVLDAKGELCPLPLLKAKLALNRLSGGQTLKVMATDHTSLQDIPAYCRISGHKLLASMECNGEYVYIIKKQTGR